MADAGPRNKEGGELSKRFGPFAVFSASALRFSALVQNYGVGEGGGPPDTFPGCATAYTNRDNKRVNINTGKQSRTAYTSLKGIVLVTFLIVSCAGYHIFKRSAKEQNVLVLTLALMA